MLITYADANANVLMLIRYAQLRNRLCLLHMLMLMCLCFPVMRASRGFRQTAYGYSIPLVVKNAQLSPLRNKGEKLAFSLRLRSETARASRDFAIPLMVKKSQKKSKKTLYK